MAEHIVHHAILIKKIKADCPLDGRLDIQAGLDELAKTPEFTKILHDEAASRGLVLEAVIQCIALAYKIAFYHAPVNDYIITLYNGDCTADEAAVLAAFLRLQSEWPYGLEWREVKRKRLVNR